MVRSQSLHFWPAILVLYLSTVWAFQNYPAAFQRQPLEKPRRHPVSQLYLFGRKRVDSNSSSLPKSMEKSRNRSFRLFGRSSNSSEGLLTAPQPTTRRDEETPEEKAARLRSDAEKIRLEAQLMDAQLTLKKIQSLERKLANAQNNTKVDRAQLQQQIDSLSKKIGIKEDTPQTIEAESSNTTSSSSLSGNDVIADAKESTPTSEMAPVWPKYVRPFNEKEFEEYKSQFDFVPQFALAFMAADFGVMADPLTNEVNRTEAIFRIYRGKGGDFSFSDKPPPVFTPNQIVEARKDLDGVREEGRELKKSRELKNESEQAMAGMDNPGRRLLVIVSSYNPDVTDDELAQLFLEYQYYCSDKTSEEKLVKNFGTEWVPFLKESSEDGADPVESLAMSSTISSLMPKSLTEATGIPSKAEVQKLMKDVLPKAKFSSSSQPTKVLGGWVIRGTFKGKDGNDFVSLLDKAMDKNLEDRLTVMYIPDFTGFLSEDGIETMIDGGLDPILYVTGPNPGRESRPVQLSIVTAIGISTCWYLSLYPFLLNTAIANRVDEELALLDAGMSPDLNWLTDLTLPLFATFVAIQVAHELGHAVVAQSNGIKTYPPTFVPSIITGITSSVTSLKKSPKNLSAIFDFAIAGPVAGILASLFALLVGSRLSLLDNSMYPALPLEILRQSTLGGGIIDGILGEGALNVPNAALGTEAVAQMRVPLHPMAVAGYIGLIVNSLSLLPVGTTDGGRIALALFGRGSKSFIGSAFLVALFFAGFAGSDLFLFYFSFVLAFETGNEIPARNEVDTIDIPRVCLAASTYFVAALALIPFQ